MVRIKKTPLKARRGLKHSNGASIHSKASSEGHSPSTRSRRQSSNSAQNQTLSDSIVIDSSPKKKGKQAKSPENKSGFHKPDIEAKGCSDNALLVSDNSDHQSPGKNVDTPSRKGKGGPKKKSESSNELESSFGEDCMMTHVHTRFNGSRNRHDSAADEVASIELNITDESGANKPKPKPINNSETPRTRSKIKQDNNIDRSDSRLDTRQGKGIEVNTPATKPSMTDKYTEDSQFLTDLEQLRDSIEVQTVDRTSIGIEKHLAVDNGTEDLLVESITLIDPPCKIKRGSPRKGLKSINPGEVLDESDPPVDQQELDMTLDSPHTRTRSTNLTKPPCAFPIQKEPKPVTAACTPSNNHKGPGRRNKPDSSCESGPVDQCVIAIGTHTTRSKADLMDGPQTPGEAEFEHSDSGESSVGRTSRTRNELNRLKIDMTISSPSPSSRTITGAASCGADLMSPTRSMYRRSDKSSDELMSPTRFRTRRSDKSSDELISPTRSRTRRSDMSCEELISPRSRSRRSDMSNLGSPSHPTRNLSEKDAKQKIISKPRSQSPGKSPGLRIKRVWSPRSGVYQGLMPGLLRERQLHLWRHHTNIEAESDTHSDDSDDDFNDLSGDSSESETSGTESKTSGTESETNADEVGDLEDRDSDEDPLHGANKISRPDRILPARTCKSPWSSPNSSTISTRSSTRRRGTSLPLSPDFMKYQTKMASPLPDSTSCEVKSSDLHHRNSSELEFHNKSNTLEQPDFAGKTFGILQSPSLPGSSFPNMKSPKAGCLANVMGSPALPMGQPTKTSGSEESMHQSNFDKENPDYESRHRSPACIPSVVEQVQNPLVPVEVPSDNSKNLTDAYKGPLLASNSQSNNMKSQGTVTSPGIKRVVPSPLMGRRIMSPYRAGNLSSAFAPPRPSRTETGIPDSSQCKTAGHEDNDPGPSTSTGGMTSTTPGKKHKSVTLNDRLGGMQPGLYIDKETLQICSRQVPIRDKKAKRAPISAANLEIMRSRQRMLIERQEELATKRNLLRRQHQFDSGEYNRIALDNRERKNPNAQVQCGRKIRFHEVELRLLNVYAGLMESLEEGKVNHDKCAEYLQKFCQLPLSHYLVRKHHYVVLDILQICFYRDSRKLRKMAKLAMSRVRSMFTIREDRCFMDTFLEEIDTMLKANYEAKKKKGILKERRTQTEADPTVSNMVTIDTLHDDSLDSMMGEAPSGEQRPAEGAADQDNDKESRRRPAVNADQNKGQESSISDDDQSADSDDSSSSCDMSEYVGRAASSRRVVRDNTSSDDSDHEVSSLSLSYLESKLSDLSDSFLDVDSDSVSKQLLSFLNEEEAGLSNPKAFSGEHGLSDPPAFRGDHDVSEAGPSNREESKEDLGFSNAAAFRMDQVLSDPSAFRANTLEHEVLGSSNLQINVMSQSDPPENEVKSVKSGQASDINVSRPPSRNGREYRASPRNQTPINQLHRTINHPSSSAHNEENDHAKQTDIDDLFDGLIAGDVALGDINITDYIEDTDHENVLNEFRTNQGTAMNTRSDGVSVSDTGFSLKSSKTVDPKAVASSSESEASSNPQPDLLRREYKAITESNNPTSGMQTRKKRRQFICPLKTASIRDAGPSRDSSENTDCGTSRDSPENSRDAGTSRDSPENSRDAGISRDSPKNTRDARTSRDSPENTRNEVISKDSPENTSNAGTPRASPENTRDAETSRDSPENTRDAGTSRDSSENTRDAGRSRDSPENTADAGRSRDSPENTTNVLISKVNVQPDLSQVMTEISARNEMNSNFERAANTVSTWTPRTTRLKVREYVQNVISKAEKRAADKESSDESNTHESPNLSSGELSSARGDFINEAKPPLEDGSRSSSEESFTPRTSARLKQRKAVNDYDQRPSSWQEHSTLALPGELELTFEIPHESPQRQEPVVTGPKNCDTGMKSLVKMKTNSDGDSISDTSILYSSETDDPSEKNHNSKRHCSKNCADPKSRRVTQGETDNLLATCSVDSNKIQVVHKETDDPLATNGVDANRKQEQLVVQKEVPTLRNISETSARSAETGRNVSKTPSSDEKDDHVFVTKPDSEAVVLNHLNVGDEFTGNNLNEVTRTSKGRKTKTKVSNPVSNVNSKPESRVKSDIIDGEKTTQEHESKLGDLESALPQPLPRKSTRDLRTSIGTITKCVLIPDKHTRRSSTRPHTTEVINLDDQVFKQELIDDHNTYDSESGVAPKENVSSIQSNENIQDVENPTLVCEFEAEDQLEINKSEPPLPPKKSSRNRRKRRGKKMTLEKSQVINMDDVAIKQELIYDHDPYHLESEVLPKENNTKDDHESQKIHTGVLNPGKNTVHQDELSAAEASLEMNNDKVSISLDTSNSEIIYIQEENASGIDSNENPQDVENPSLVYQSVTEDVLERNQSEPLVPPKKSTRNRRKRKRGKKMTLEKSQVINLDDVAIKQEIIDNQSLGDLELEVVPKQNAKDDHENQMIHREDGLIAGRNTRSSRRHPTQSISSPAVCPDESSPSTEEVDPEKNNISHDVHNNIQEENASGIDSNENLQDAENPTAVSKSVTEDVLEKNQSEPQVRPKKSAHNRRRKRGKKMALEKSQVIDLVDVAIKQELIDDHDPGDSQTEVVPGENNAKDDHEDQKVPTEDVSSPSRNTRSSKRHENLMHSMSAQNSPVVHQVELLTSEVNLEKNNNICHDTSNSEIDYIQEENASGIDSNENPQDLENPTLGCGSVAEDAVERNQSEPPVPAKKSARRKKQKRNKKMTLEESQVINVDDEAIKEELNDDHNPYNLELVPEEDGVKHDHENHKIFTEDVLIAGRHTRSSKRHQDTMQEISQITLPSVCPEVSTTLTGEADVEKNNIGHDVSNSEIDYIQEENASGIDSNENPQDVENLTLVSESVTEDALEKNQYEPLVPPEKSARNRRKGKRGKKMTLEKMQVINLDDVAIEQELIDDHDPGDSQTELVPGENNSKDIHENEKVHLKDVTSPGRNARSSKRHENLMQRISEQTSPAVHQDELLDAEANLETNSAKVSIRHDTSNSEISYIQEENASSIDSNENLQYTENLTSVSESVTEDVLERNQSEPLVPPKKSTRNRRKRKQGKKMMLEKSQVINLDDVAIKQEFIDDHNPGNSRTEVVPGENNMREDHENRRIHTDVLCPGRNTRSSKRHKSLMQSVSAQTSPAVCQDELSPAEASLETNNDEVSICHDSCNSEINNIQEQNAPGIDSNENPQDLENSTSVSESVAEDAVEKNQSEPPAPQKKTARSKKQKQNKKMVLEKSHIINVVDESIKQELSEDKNPGDSQTEVVPGENNAKDVHENQKVHLEDVTSQGRNTQSMRHENLLQSMSAQNSPAVHQVELMVAEANLEKNNNICHANSNSEIDNIQEENASSIDSNENPLNAENLTLVCESITGDVLEKNQSEPLVRPKKSARKRTKKSGKKMVLEKLQVINLNDVAIKQELIDDHDPGGSQTELVPGENSKDDHGNPKIQTEDFPSPGRNTRSSQRRQSIMHCISAQTSPAVHQNELLAAEASLEKNDDISHDTSNSETNYIQEVSTIDSNENLQDAEDPTLVCESVAEDTLETNQSEPLVQLKKSGRNRSMRRKRQQGKKMTLEKSQVINVDDKAIKQEVIDDHKPGESQTEVVPKENNTKDDHQNQKIHTEDFPSPGRNTRLSQKHQSSMQRIDTQTLEAVHQDELTAAEANLETNNDEVSICHGTNNSTIDYIQEEPTLVFNSVPEDTEEKNQYIQKENISSTVLNENLQDVENPILVFDSVPNEAVEKNQSEPPTLPKKSARNRKRKRGKKINVEKSKVINLDDRAIKQELIDGYDTGDLESGLVSGENNSKDDHEMIKTSTDSSETPGEELAEIIAIETSKVTPPLLEQKGNGLHGVIGEHRTKNRTDHGEGTLDSSIIPEATVSQGGLVENGETGQDSSEITVFEVEHLQYKGVSDKLDLSSNQNENLPITEEDYQGSPVCECDITVPNPEPHCQTSAQSQLIMADSKAKGENELQVKAEDSPIEIVDTPHNSKITKSKSRRRKGRRKSGKTKIPVSVSVTDVDKQQELIEMTPESESAHSTPETTSDPHLDDVTLLESRKVLLDEKQAVVETVPESVPSIPESPSNPHLDDATLLESSNVMLDEKQTVVGLIPETFVLSIPESTSDPHLDDVTSLESSKVLFDEKQAVVGIVPSNPESTSKLHLDDVNSLEPSNQMLDKKQVEVGKIPETSVPSNPESTSDLDDVNSLKPSNQILDKQQVEVGIVPESVPSNPESTSELHLDDAYSLEQMLDKKQVVVEIIPESVPSTPQSDLHLGGVTSLESNNQTSEKVKTTNTLLVEDTLMPLSDNTAEKSVDHSLDPDDVSTSELESEHSTTESSSNLHLDVTSPESKKQNLGKMMLVVDPLTNEVDTTEKSTTNLQLDVISLESSEPNFRKITLAEDPLTNKVDTAEKSVDQSLNSADVSISESESAHSITVASPVSNKQILGDIIVVEDPPTNEVDAADNSVNHNRYPADADPTVGTEKLDYLPEGSGESVPKQSAMQNVEPRQLRRQKTSENDRQKLSGNMSCQLGESPQIVNSSSSVTSGSNEQPPNDLSSPVKNEPVDSSWVEFDAFEDGESGISAGVADRNEVSNQNAKPRKKRKSVFGPPRKSKMRKSIPRKISDSVTWESLDLYPVVKLEPIDYSTNLSSGKSQPNNSEAEKLIQTEPVKKRQPTKRKIPSSSEDAVKNCDSFQTAQNQTANTKVAEKNPKSVLQKKPNRTCEISELCEPTLGNCPNVKTEPSECDSMEASVTPEPRYGLQRMRKSPRITPIVNYDERNHDQKESDMSIKIESDTLLSFSQESVCSSTDSNRCGLQKTRKSPRMRPMVNYDERNDDQMETNTPIKIESNTLLSSYQESDLLSTDSDQYCLWQTRKSPRMRPMVNYDERSPRKKSSSLPTSPAYKSTKLRPNSADIKSSPAPATSPSVPSSPANNDAKPRPDTADAISPPPPRKRRKTSLSVPSSQADEDTKPSPAGISRSPAALRRLRETSVSLPPSPAYNDTKPGPYSSPSAASRKPRRKSVSLPTSPAYEGTKIRPGPADANSSPASPGRPRKTSLSVPTSPATNATKLRPGPADANSSPASPGRPRKTSLSLPSSPADKIAKPRPGPAEANSSPAIPRRLRKTSSSVSSSPADGIADIKSSPSPSRKPSRRKSVSLPTSPTYQDTKPRRGTVDTISSPATPRKLRKTSLSFPSSPAGKIAKPRPGPAETDSSPAAPRKLRKTSLSVPTSPADKGTKPRSGSAETNSSPAAPSSPADGIADIKSSPPPSRKPRKKSVNLPASPTYQDTKPRPVPADTNSSPCPPKRARKTSLSVPSSPGDKVTNIRPVPADINSSPYPPKRHRKDSLSVPSSPADGIADINRSPATSRKPRRKSVSLPASPVYQDTKPRPGIADDDSSPVTPRKYRKNSLSVLPSLVDGIADIKSSPAASRKPRRKSVSLPASPVYKETKTKPDTSSPPVTPKKSPGKTSLSIPSSPADRDTKTRPGTADTYSSPSISRKPSRRKSVSLPSSPVCQDTKPRPGPETNSPPVTPRRSSRKRSLSLPSYPADKDTKPRPGPAATSSLLASP